jgi:hypothetical protein
MDDMDTDTQKLIQQIRDDDRRHADLLLGNLEKIAKGGKLRSS